MNCCVAFYLPVVTPWWFDNIIAPLVRVMARDCTVHVLVPPLRNGTGIEAEQLYSFFDFPDTEWHILDDEAQPDLRNSLAGRADIVELMAAIDPDIIFCRCADAGPLRHFTGEVRYIMEGAVPPFPTDPTAIMIDRSILSFGAIPDLSAAQREALTRDFAPLWTRAQARAAQLPSPDWRGAAGCAGDRKVALIVLEYEHPENHFLMHRQWRSNAAWIQEVAANLDPSIFLAVTNHPLNNLYVDNGPVHAAIAELGSRAAMIDQIDAQLGATEMVVRDCDGVVIDLSKSYALAAFYGKPIFRRSQLPTAAWLRATDDFAQFEKMLDEGCPAPDQQDARLWFAWHAANNLIDPQADDLTAADIIDHVAMPANPARWRGNIARMAAFAQCAPAC